MGLIFTPVLVRRVLGPLGLSGPVTAVALLGLIGAQNSPVGKHNLPPAAHLPPPPTPPHPILPDHPPTCAICNNYSSCEKIAQNPAVSAS